MTDDDRDTIRVVVVDDSVVIRRLVTTGLDAEPGITVVGVAANGRLGLERIEATEPDAVVLDIEMPEMDGLATLPHLRRRWPRLPVLMFSTVTERGAAATLEALSLGATDYVTKPSGPGSPDEIRAAVSAEVAAKLRVICASRSGGARTPVRGRLGPGHHDPVPDEPPAGDRPPAVRSDSPSPSLPAGYRPPPVRSGPAGQGGAPPARVEVLVIGSSTGGPNALAQLLAGMPADLPVPVLVVQHMPPMFTKLLADRLAAKTPLHFAEAADGEPLVAGQGRIAPGDWHLRVVAGPTGVHLTLDQQPPEQSCRPAVDVLFRSAAATFGPGCLGVVLTGMGSDGTDGSRSIAGAGGGVLVQDEATSVVWGMPGNIARLGLADAVLPLGSLASEVVDRIGRCRAPIFPPRLTPDNRPGRWAGVAGNRP